LKLDVLPDLLTRLTKALLVMVCLLYTHLGWTAAEADLRVEPGLHYLDDRLGDVTLREVLSSELDWQQVENEGLLQLGYLAEPVWLRFQFEVLAPQHSRYYLELVTPFLNYVDFFLIQHSPQGKILLRHRVAGDKQKSHAPTLEHRFPLFELDNLPVGKYELYVRMQSDSVLSFPVRMVAQTQFFQNEFRVQAFYGLFFGVMAALVFYNAYVWYFLRDRTNLYNAAFILSAMLYQASVSGFGIQYLWDYGSLLSDKGYGLGILLTIFFAGRFAVRFIDLRNRQPRLAQLTDWMVTICGLLVIPVLLLPERQVMPIIYSIELLVCAYSLVALIQQCITGNYWARFLLVGWSVLFSGTFLYVGAQLGYIRHSLTIEYWHAGGLALGNLVVTAALAARIQRERRDKKEAIERALQLAQEVADLTREKEQIEASARDELDRRVNQKTRDLTVMLDQMKSSNKALEHATFTDQLTGVGNRRLLDSCFPGLIEQCQKTRSPLGVLVIDADHFKRINDQFGHLMGDDCLKKIAAILERFSRRDLDVLARYGGEEFVLLLPGTDQDGVLQVAETIRTQVQYVSFWHAGQRVPVSVSIGAFVDVPSISAQGSQLLEKADAALYEAKSSGRNCVRLYDPKTPLIKS